MPNQWLNLVGRIYSLDTLDQRLTKSSEMTRGFAQPSKWRSPEFYFYYVVFLVIPPLMFKSVYDVSKGNDNCDGDGDGESVEMLRRVLFRLELTVGQNHIQTIRDSLIFYPTAGFPVAKWSVPCSDKD